jgi:hypothetical protein
MSMTTTEILQRMISEGGQIAVLRGPTPKYKELISVCRGDGVAGGTLSREILNDRIEANLVEQDGRENECKLAIFKLTDHGSKKAAGSRLEKYLKAKLISLGYRWPEHLEAKSIAWLEAEISAIGCRRGRQQRPPYSQFLETQR